MRPAALLLASMLLSAVPASGDVLAIVNARAFTGTAAGVIDGATILIEDGRITQVRAGGAAPAGARVLDARGRLVTPGLMNAFTHLGLVEVSTAKETSDQSASAGPLGAGFDVQPSLNANSVLVPLARADGLTRALVAPAASPKPPFAGLAAVVRLQDGTLLDRAMAAEVAVTGGETAVQAGGSRSLQWQTLRAALVDAAARKAERKGSSASGSSIERLERDALDAVVDGRVPLVLRADRESDLRQAEALLHEFAALRLVIVGGAEAWRVAPLFAERHVAVIVDPFANLPMSFDQIGARLDNAALLQKAGVEVAFFAPGIHMSHDAGLAVREGAGIAVANGLPWDAALRALTVNPASLFGIADRYGTLETGREADLVIWSGDPLEVTSAPDVVLMGGREVSLTTRQRALAERYHPTRRAEPAPPGR